MFFKEKILLDIFIKKQYIPYIDAFIESEIDQLYQTLSSDFSIEKRYLAFELTLLLNYMSGKVLSTIKGCDTDRMVKLIIEFQLSKFKDLTLDLKWLTNDYHDSTSEIGAIINYYLNKSTAYRNAEISFIKKEIVEVEFHTQLCAIFFSIEDREVDINLLLAMDSIYKGISLYFLPNLYTFSKKYRLV